MPKRGGGYTIKQWDQLCREGKKPGRQSLPYAVREYLDRKYQSTCGICGLKSYQDSHYDHIIPLAAGGTNETKNLWILCRRCNLRKGGRIGGGRIQDE